MAPQLKTSSLPERRSIASYTRYADAQWAVDCLSDHQFPVERTAIVGDGLRVVEQVTGRLTRVRAIANGVLSGAVTGVMIAIVVTLLGHMTPTLTIVLLATGAFSGAFVAAVEYTLSGGRRDFTSTQGLYAERYEVMVDSELVGEASELLRRFE